MATARHWNSQDGMPRVSASHRKDQTPFGNSCAQRRAIRFIGTNGMRGSMLEGRLRHDLELLGFLRPVQLVNGFGSLLHYSEALRSGLDDVKASRIGTEIDLHH